MNYLVKRITRKKLGDVMAKNNDIETVETEVTEKKPGVFQKIFYWLIIPLTFTIAIVLIIAQFTNTNVFQIVDGVVEKLPFVDSEEEIIETAATNQEKVVTLQAEIQEKEAEISKLQSEIDSTNVKNEELVIEIERLQYEIESMQRQQSDTQIEQKEILKTFETMSAKKAAPILTAMTEQEALRILSSMKSDKLAEILSKMDPTDAARFTELLAQQ